MNVKAFGVSVFFSVVLFSGVFGQSSYAAVYNLDKPHTAVTFKIKHLMIATVNGRFDQFEGTLDFDEKTNKLAKVDVKIDLDSINTANTERDDHLRGADFFGVRNEKKEIVEPKRYMTFVMKDVKTKGKKIDKVIGDLTLNGVTKPVTLTVDYKGSTMDPWGNEKVVFNATTRLSRADFGITWNKPMDKVAGVVVGDEVEVTIEAEANKAKEPA